MELDDVSSDEICVESGQMVTKEVIDELKETSGDTVKVKITVDQLKEAIEMMLQKKQLQPGKKLTAVKVEDERVEKTYNKNGTATAVVSIDGIPSGGRQQFSVAVELLGGAFENVREGQKGPVYLVNLADAEKIGKQTAVKAAAATDGLVSTDRSRMAEWKHVGDRVEFTLDQNIQDFNPGVDVFLFATKPISEVNMIELPDSDTKEDAEQKKDEDKKEKEATKEDEDITDDDDDEDEGGDTPGKLKKTEANNSDDASLALKGAGSPAASVGALPATSGLAPLGAQALEFAKQPVFGALSLVCLVGATLALRGGNRKKK